MYQLINLYLPFFRQTSQVHRPIQVVLITTLGSSQTDSIEQRRYERLAEDKDITSRQMDHGRIMRRK